MGRPKTTTKVTRVCECCGKEKTLYPSEINGKVFFTCSKECKHIMLGRNNKKMWAEMSPQKRAEWIDKINYGHSCDGQGFIDYWAVHNEKMLEHTVNAIKNHTGGIQVKERINMKLSQSPCVLLKAHAIIMKDDPERLQTSFIQELIGIRCRNHDENETHLQQTEPEKNTSD